MVLYGLLQPTTHLVSPGLPRQALQARNHRVELRAATLASYDDLAHGSQTKSIHLFPEGGMTNGRGMMTFSRGFMRFAQGI
ncbi:hypothetical protein WJX73_006621 [Symbiochloris irregularis]|uniref:Uncharacterized protein n=1 Tax=Symbiochloris irregularis TaxID=706552 RepID=A0AAW1P9K4_9CHLO